ncbi:polyketide biosynthesis methyltransferase [Bacterioplanes sanyensis]|uniref:Polyketide biosynthesis methyltransferase n=1 Tax=Bacterioplanes sanyensis TaxID=1249553 RepID=A0A222FNY7_9GAMM|nr:class I SAM-dependent methyltransferase [Bacterioplanes sanyensis]ASP40727.1 polyketide biosynthesis methyltransferase [Bacterioplanes sanyensis]
MTTSTETADTSRISISAHYTGMVWLRHGLSAPAFATTMGRLSYATLAPINWLLTRLAGANIDIFLLQRHKVLDAQLRELIEHHGVTQVVELAAGLSPRGYRLYRQYPQLTYIESDLPAMAQRKSKLLERLTSNAKHSMRPCNILEQQGPDSIEALLEQLDKQQPTVVISEGLVNYFALEQIRPVWARIASALSAFPAGYYVTDLYPDLVEHPSYRYVKLAQKLVGFFTRGQWPLHYRSNDAIAAGFEQDGFTKVSVIDPADCYGKVDIPRVKTPTMVRIIKAKA